MGRKSREKRPAAPGAAPAAVEKRRRARGSPPLYALLAVAAVLVLTCEERLQGLISDERQTLNTAIAVARLGEIGIARGELFTTHRAGGDAVSPYGIGMALAQAVPAFLAGPFERAFGAGSSDTLFVLPPFLLVLSAAAGAGLLAREVGATPAGAAVAIVAVALGSPLWAYASTSYSEPMQAASLVFAVFFAVRSGRARTDAARFRHVAVAGLFAGLAVLAKSVNLVLLPVVLLPALFGGAEGRRLRWRGAGIAAAGAAAGGAAPLALWLGFEMVRFGRPLGSYGGLGFSHSLLDGLWRLVVGENKGLLWFFPLLPVAVAGLVLLARKREHRPAAVAAAAVTLVLLGLSATWWAWDGTVGWGPRLLVPAIPVLAAAASVALSSPVWRRAAIALVALGIAVNGLGVLQSDAATVGYLQSTPPVPLTPEEAARFPRSFLSRAPGGGPAIERHFVAALDPAFAPIRVHLHLIAARLGAGGTSEIDRRLLSPPWLGRHPEALPKLSDLPRYQRSPLRWPVLGSALFAAPLREDGSFKRVFLSGLQDQVLRALDTGKLERAVELSSDLYDRAPDSFPAALCAEALRASGRPEALQSFLASLRPEVARSPAVGIVAALRARDAGDAASAYRILAAVGRSFETPALRRALLSPLPAWPSGFHALVGENLGDLGD